MKTDSQHKVKSPKMDDKTFTKFSKFIYSNYGIQMPEGKRIMLESRLQKRLRFNGIDSFAKYYEYIFSDEGKLANEVVSMIDEVSTNKTDFFRENAHFEYMKEHLLPQLHSENKGDEIKVWCSAASTGEEPYTISMVFENFNQGKSPLRYSILGTDISTSALKKCVNAVYAEDRVEVIPLDVKRRYFLRSKNAEKRTYRIIPQLRNKMKFQRLNLIDSTYKIDEMFDVIFCRNVLIYFDRETQKKVVNKLCEKLKPGGIFFLGHSESILGMEAPLKQVKPTIYTKF